MNYRRPLLLAVAAAVATGAAACAGLAVLWGNGFHPRPVSKAAITCPASAPTVPRGQTVRMLVWNLQFAAGRKHQFFYDGGPAVSVPEADVRDTLDGIAEVIRAVDPDIVVLQEVDRGSDRTHRIDQHRALLETLDYPCHVSTPYHRAPYVPHPPQEHLGKVDMHLSVWSRYRMDHATRYDLPRLKESVLRQQFNLKRALLAVDLPVQDGSTLVVFDSHLSAFSRQDGTLPAQLTVIDQRLNEASDAGHAWVLGADLNALPPGDDPARLVTGGELYGPVSPLTDWYSRHASAVALHDHRVDPTPWYTYLPWQSDRPDRAIDHVFHSPEVSLHSFAVLQQVNGLSDHHPLQLDFSLP